MAQMKHGGAFPIQLPRVDWADSLTGDSEAHHVRQILAQDVLLEELWGNERVRSFFAPWFARLERECRSAETENALVAIIKQATEEMATPLANLCARELGVAQWAVMDLYRRFFYVEFRSRMTSESFWIRNEVVLDDPVATADYEATFKICKGMSVKEAQRALAEFTMRVILETGMDGDDEPRRSRRERMPKKEGEALARDTRWYYRARIRGERVTEIARKDSVAYQLVQQAIKRVGPLVEVFTMPPAATRTKRRTRKARPRKSRRRSPRL